MKSTLSSALALLSAVTAMVASADGNQDKRCASTDSILSLMEEPTNSAYASEYCSYIFEPKTTVTVYTTTNSYTVTTGPLTTSTSVSTVTEDGTSTVYCPATPTSSAICDQPGYVFIDNLIIEFDSITGEECQQNCLEDSACGGFLYGSSGSNPPVCDLINRPIQTSDIEPGSPYNLYDRDCQNFLAPQCTPLAKRDYPVPEPTYLSGDRRKQISSACHCLIGQTKQPKKTTVSEATYTVTDLTVTKTYSTLTWSTITTPITATKVTTIE
ncbi:MAG: hypothetical protein M1838_001033 [Thelocarpon superellum]|nr:MAG: hypothetical protein M1838_001033 [Thelocarpon superellum]